MNERALFGCCVRKLHGPKQLNDLKNKPRQRPSIRPSPKLPFRSVGRSFGRHPLPFWLLIWSAKRERESEVPIHKAQQTNDRTLIHKHNQTANQKQVICYLFLSSFSAAVAVFCCGRNRLERSGRAQTTTAIATVIATTTTTTTTTATNDELQSLQND